MFTGLTVLYSSNNSDHGIIQLLTTVITDWLSKLTPEEKEKLYQGIGYDENANVAMLPREVIIVFLSTVYS